MLVVGFGVQPSEAWQMTPHDYWTLHRFKFEAHKPDPPTKQDLWRMMKEDEERRKRGDNHR